LQLISELLQKNPQAVRINVQPCSFVRLSYSVILWNNSGTKILIFYTYYNKKIIFILHVYIYIYIYIYALGSGLILGFIIYLRKVGELPTFNNQDLPAIDLLFRVLIACAATEGKLFPVCFPDIRIIISSLYYTLRFYDT